MIWKLATHLLCVSRLQEGFAGLRDIYYKTGDGFLLVYAVNDKSSMDDVRERFQSLLNSRVSQHFVFPSM